MNLRLIYLKLGLLPLSPGFLDLDAAAQLLQHEFPGVVVDDEHAVLLVRPLVSFEYRHGRRGALGGQNFHQIIAVRKKIPGTCRVSHVQTHS